MAAPPPGVRAALRSASASSCRSTLSIGAWVPSARTRSRAAVARPAGEPPVPGGVQRGHGSPAGVTSALRRGCRTNPRRGHWSRSTGGLRKWPSRSSAITRGLRPGAAPPLWHPRPRARSTFPETALCDTLREYQDAQKREEERCAIGGRSPWPPTSGTGRQHPRRQGPQGA